MNENKPETSQSVSIGRGLVEGSAIGVQTGCLGVGIVILGLLLGLWLDAQLHTRPWLTLALLMLSMPVSIYAIYRFALRVARKANRRERTSTEDKSS